jgi:two-component system chemotaxis response regulator CheY
MGYNVLVVDDSKVVRSVVIRTLRMARLDVGEIHEAANGKQALDVLETAWVDICFADINMPVMDGIQLIDEMHARKFMEKVPVVIISTERSETRIEELKAKGISAYLRKPFTPENIREVLGNVLGPGAIRDTEDA